MPHLIASIIFSGLAPFPFGFIYEQYLILIYLILLYMHDNNIMGYAHKLLPARAASRRVSSWQVIRNLTEENDEISNNNSIISLTECPFCDGVRRGGVGVKLKSHGSRLEGRTRRDDVDIVEVLDTVRNRRKWHASAKFGLSGTAAILNIEPGLCAIRNRTRVIIIIIMMMMACFDRFYNNNNNTYYGV